MQHRKVYVSVNLDVDTEGQIRPRSITWEDGHIYEIDRLKQRIRAASTKVGGCGIRYTVMICGNPVICFQSSIGLFQFKRRHKPPDFRWARRWVEKKRDLQKIP